METNLISLTIIIAVFIFVFYLTRYLDGYYTITSSEIIEKGKLSRGGMTIGQYYIIKTIYANNRITITKSEHY
jgi:hypothetical protein